MRKNFNKYISRGMVAALLLASMPLQTVSGAEAANSENVLESETSAVTVTEDIGSVADYPDGAGNADVETEDIAENVQADVDSEDVTDAFKDPNFQAEVRKAMNLGENDPITKDACANITGLDVRGKDIGSLVGIGNFPNLRWLGCGENKLTSLDVSNCTNLESLECWNNQLASLDIGNCTSLETLSCYDNQLTSLDINNCANLETLECWDNQLTSLDINDCTNLKNLYCYDNQLASLDVGGCPSLENLSCSSGQLTSLNIMNP